MMLAFAKLFEMLFFPSWQIIGAPNINLAVDYISDFIQTSKPIARFFNTFGGENQIDCFLWKCHGVLFWPHNPKHPNHHADDGSDGKSDSSGDFQRAHGVTIMLSLALVTGARPLVMIAPAS